MLLKHLNTFPIDDIPRTGTLEAWTTAANMLFAPSCEAQACALLASFASPLMSLFRTQHEAGSLISIYGGKKSGKTVAMVGAGSVWAVPAKLYLTGALKNEGYEKLTELGNIPALCDTFTNYDPYRANGFICDVLFGWYAKANYWRGNLISQSGISLFDAIANLNREHPPLGLEFKVAVPAGLRVDRLDYKLASNAGQACVPYLRYLAKDKVLRWARQELVSRSVRLKEEFKLDDTSRYAMRAISGIHVAGLITTKLELLDFDVERITRWAASQAFPVPKAPRSHPPTPPPPQESPTA